MIYLYMIFLGLAAFSVTLLVTRVLILKLRDTRILIDKPNQRSNHINPVPRAGGVAVMLAMLIYLSAAGLPLMVVMAMVLLTLVSLMDDMLSLSPIIRLLVQVVAVTVVLQTHHFTFFIDFLPTWLCTSIIALMWLWFINLFNFMDGIDGLAVTEVIGISVGILFITALTDDFESMLTLYTMIAFGAASGFMWWNWHPAKIFLGDVGSVPLGFFVFYLLLLLAENGFGLQALILPAYFVMDASVTLIRRLINKEKIWQAHSDHYYQRAVKATGGKHDVVTRIVFGVNIILIALAAFPAIMPELTLVCVMLAYSMVGYILWYFSSVAASHPSSAQGGE